VCVSPEDDKDASPENDKGKYVSPEYDKDVHNMRFEDDKEAPTSTHQPTTKPASPTTVSLELASSPSSLPLDESEA